MAMVANDETISSIIVDMLAKKMAGNRVPILRFTNRVMP